jgi:PAS domain S-box-containing protein
VSRLADFAELMDAKIRQIGRERMDSGRASFEAVADRLPSIVWTARADGHIGFFNRAYGEFTGDPLMTWTDAIHPNDLPMVLTAWEAAVASGDPYEARFRCKCHDGAYHWIVGRARPVRDIEGAIQYWIGSACAIAEESAVILAATA